MPCNVYARWIGEAKRSESGGQTSLGSFMRPEHLIVCIWYNAPAARTGSWTDKRAVLSWVDGTVTPAIYSYRMYLSLFLSLCMSVSGYFFFWPPLKCACSCKQIFRSSNLANNCNEPGLRAGRSVRGIIIKFAYESISVPMHRHTHTQTHTHASGCGCVATAHKLWQLKSIN